LDIASYILDYKEGKKKRAFNQKQKRRCSVTGIPYPWSHFFALREMLFIKNVAFLGNSIVNPSLNANQMQNNETLLATPNGILIFHLQKQEEMCL
jgi:hypothetical protein